MKKPETFEEFRERVSTAAYHAFETSDDSTMQELWDAMRPDCQHDFQPVYNYGQPFAYQIPAETPTSRIIEIMEATKARTYRGHVCKKCGKTVNMEEQR